MQNSDFESIILGIDPGFKRIGYGVVGQTGSVFTYLRAGMVRTPRDSSTTSLDLAQTLDTLIEGWHPTLFAIEKVFFGHNKTSVLAVSEIKGVILFRAHTHSLPIIELTPLEVKSIVCGYGKADKAAVRKIITNAFPETKDIKSKDAIDGLAIALAGHYKYKNQERLRGEEK